MSAPDVFVALEPPRSSGESALSRLLLDHVEAQIRSTDTKAVFIVTANAFLVNSLANIVWMLPGAIANGQIGILTKYLIACDFLALVGSTLWALMVIRPRLAPPQSSGLLFFGTIGAKKEQDFIREFRAQDPDALFDAVLAQVHAKSRIASQKYADIKWSIQFLLVGLWLWAIALILRVFFA